MSLTPLKIAGIPITQFSSSPTPAELAAIFANFSCVEQAEFLKNVDWYSVQFYPKHEVAAQKQWEFVAHEITQLAQADTIAEMLEIWLSAYKKQRGFV